MSFLSSLIGAVQNYFSPKPAVQNTVPSVQPGPSARSVPGQGNNAPIPGATAKSTPSTPVRSTPTPGPQARSTPQVSQPSRSSGGSSGGGGNPQGSVPSNTTAGQPDILNGISDVVKPLEQAAAPVLGKLGKGLTTAGTALHAPQIIPGGLGAAAQGWAGFQQQVEQAKKEGWLPDIPNFMSGVSQFGPATSSDVLNQIWNFVQGKKGGGTIIANPNLWQALQAGGSNLPQGSPTGQGRLLPSAASTSRGQILPNAAKTGAPQGIATGIVPAPFPSARQGVVPSLVNAANLPANMQGLTAQNVNPALAQSMTPEAIQSLGQLLLRSLVGNQSSLTSLNPGIAQALWGAPTAASAFGGYDGGAAVPSQTSIQQPKNIPPIPQPLAQG